MPSNLQVVKQSWCHKHQMSKSKVAAAKSAWSSLAAKNKLYLRVSAVYIYNPQTLFPLPLCLCSNLQDIKGFYHKLRRQHIGVKLISVKDAWS